LTGTNVLIFKYTTMQPFTDLKKWHARNQLENSGMQCHPAPSFLELTLI